MKFFRRKALRQLVSRLPAEQEELVVGHVVKKVPLEELAQRLGRPRARPTGSAGGSDQQPSSSVLPSILAEIDQLFQALTAIRDPPWWT